MRTGITIGITKDGEAEIIHHPSVTIDEQKRSFNDLGAGKGDKYSEIQYWESGRGLRRRKSFGDKGNVNFNAAHLVENQQAKGKRKKKLADLTPAAGEKGRVDFNAAHPVEKQQAKGKKKTKLPDLNDAQDAGAIGEKAGINWDSVTPVADQGKKKKSSSKKKSSKKSATKSAGKSSSSAAAEKKARQSGQPDRETKAADKVPRASGSDAGPTL